MVKRYRVVEGGMQDRFRHARKKVQIIGGGYGNGKTAACCIKALNLSINYPGCNGLIARATYPKLNDTIKKELLSWCPQEWIKRAPTKDDNTLILTNGSTINFRYVAQQGKNAENTTSNLLSATYDWIVVDQMEDPEFSHKDFMDLIGRLRGNTPYTGNDPTMPLTGPRFMMITLNPTRNWCYHKLVKPIKDFQAGRITADLLCEVDKDGKPVLDTDGQPTPIVELFEGSTYENIEAVGADYIQGMLATYTGSMRKRFVMGEWGAFEGLVYPQFNDDIHLIPQADMLDYLSQLTRVGYAPTYIEAYDHGLRVPACYMLSFVDDSNNIFVIDGFYQAEQTIEDSATFIHEARLRHGIDHSTLQMIYADPQCFRRGTGQASKVGTTVAELFAEQQIKMQRGANNIETGIAQVGQYLTFMPQREHPIFGTRGSPHLFFASELFWISNEFNQYSWKKSGSGDDLDIPSGRHDHAVDTTKYLLTNRPKLARFVGPKPPPPSFMQWHEIERQDSTKVLPRHK